MCSFKAVTTTESVVNEVQHIARATFIPVDCYVRNDREWLSREKRCIGALAPQSLFFPEREQISERAAVRDRIRQIAVDLGSSGEGAEASE
jgi:hypothetical protein